MNPENKEPGHQPIDPLLIREAKGDEILLAGILYRERKINELVQGDRHDPKRIAEVKDAFTQVEDYKRNTGYYDNDQKA